MAPHQGHVTDSWKLPAIDGLRIESSMGHLRVLSTNRFHEDLPAELRHAGATIEGVEAMTLEEIFVHAVMRGRGETK